MNKQQNIYKAFKFCFSCQQSIIYYFSPDLSESCSHYAIPAICLATLPLCDRRTEKPREICREECELLEDQFCRKELAIARQHALLGTQMVLPVCNKLPHIGSPATSTCVSIGISQVCLLTY